jgi:transposase-like protein
LEDERRFIPDSVRIGVLNPFERRTAVKRKYHTIASSGKANERKLTEFLSRNGQFLLPMVDLIEQSRMAVEELIDVAGRVTIEAVLNLSAQQVAGVPCQGKKRDGEVGWHGTQKGSVYLTQRKLQVDKPRLRTKGKGAGKEVAIPAYEAMQDRQGMGTRMLDLLMRGVTTRQYQHVLPEMAETVGVSKSSVSRETIVAAEKELERLMERRFDELELLIIYIDGMVFGDHHVIGALGVDVDGRKHLLGIQEGATENTAAVKDLLERLVAQGVDPKRKRLFVIDGSKALRTAINAVFGADNPVQRCRQHKLRNVVDRVPEDQKDQVKSLLKAAWRLEHKEGMGKIRKLSEWLERDCPAAAASLLEGLEECFTINRLEVPVSLHRCLATTNVIESPHAGVRMRTNRVSRWKDAAMVLRWVASAFTATEKNFRRIMGYKDLWALKAILEARVEKAVASKERVA